MENSYGIGVTNRYALFLDDEQDPLEALKIQESAKEQKKKSKVAEKENKTKTEVASKPKVAVPQRKSVKDTPNYKPQDNKRDDNKSVQKPSTEVRNERNKYQSANDNREERNNKRNRDDRPFNGPADGNREERERDRDRARREFGGESSEARRGRGAMGTRMRGARGGRVYDQRGKREFDRQSGSDKTGIKSVDKRDGAGAHNWGSHKDIIEEADKNEVDPAWEVEKVETTVAPVEVKEPGPETETPTVEEEPKQFTLDEWRAQKANRQKPQYNLRKAGEGEDPTQWKKMYELSKKKEGDEEESEEEEYDASEYPQRVGRQKHVLDIDIHFNDSRRGAVGGRGRGRGGGRGSRGGAGGDRLASSQSVSSNSAGGHPGTGAAGAGGPGVVLSSRPPERDGRDRPAGMRPFRAQGPPNADGNARTGGSEAEDPEHPSRTDNQRSSRPNAPKVDDEHDFPSLN